MTIFLLDRHWLSPSGGHEQAGGEDEAERCVRCLQVTIVITIVIIIVMTNFAANRSLVKWSRPLGTHGIRSTSPVPIATRWWQRLWLSRWQWWWCVWLQRGVEEKNQANETWGGLMIFSIRSLAPKTSLKERVGPTVSRTTMASLVQGWLLLHLLPFHHDHHHLILGAVTAKAQSWTNASPPLTKPSIPSTSSAQHAATSLATTVSTRRTTRHSARLATSSSLPPSAAAATPQLQRTTSPRWTCSGIPTALCARSVRCLSTTATSLSMRDSLIANSTTMHSVAVFALAVIRCFVKDDFLLQSLDYEFHFCISGNLGPLYHCYVP